MNSQNKETHRLGEWAYGCRGKDDGERTESWDGHGHTAVFKMDNQQGPVV